MPTYDYQAYSGPALPQDKIAILDPGTLAIWLDGKDLHYNWDGSLREGCEPHKLTKFEPDPFRCRDARLLVRVLPGRHTIGVRLLGTHGVEITGDGCRTYRYQWRPEDSQPPVDPGLKLFRGSLCNYSVDVPLEAGKIYSVKFYTGEVFPAFGTHPAQIASQIFVTEQPEVPAR